MTSKHYVQLWSNILLYSVQIVQIVLIVKWRFEILPLFLLRKYTQWCKSKLWPFETMMSFIDFDVITFSTIIFNISFLCLRNIPHEILFWFVYNMLNFDSQKLAKASHGFGQIYRIRRLCLIMNNIFNFVKREYIQKLIKNEFVICSGILPSL